MSINITIYIDNIHLHVAEEPVVRRNASPAKEILPGPVSEAPAKKSPDPKPAGKRGRPPKKQSYDVSPGLRRIMDDRKLTPKEAAAKCGLHATDIYAFRDGRKRAGEVTITKLMDGLGVTLEQLTTSPDDAEGGDHWNQAYQEPPK